MRKSLKEVLMGSPFYRIFYSIFWVIDIFIPKKDVTFYGYGGRFSGNTAALYLNIVGDESLSAVWLLDGRDAGVFPVEGRSWPLCTKQKRTFFYHLSLIFQLQKSKVIVLTRVGDLIEHCKFLNPNKHKLVLLMHGNGIKSFGILAKHLSLDEKIKWGRIPNRFDLISATSKLDQYLLCSGFNVPVERIKVLGPQRSNSGMIDSHETISVATELSVKSLKSHKLVMLAPTHRDHLADGEVRHLLNRLTQDELRSLDSFLSEKKIFLFVRAHFETHQKSLEFSIFNNIVSLSQQELADFDVHLPIFHGLITDYSGIYLEHLRSNLAIAFDLTDLETYQAERGLVLPSAALFPGPRLGSLVDLINFLSNVDDVSSQYMKQRALLSDLFYELDHEEALRKSTAEIRALVSE